MILSFLPSKKLAASLSFIFMCPMRVFPQFIHDREEELIHVHLKQDSLLRHIIWPTSVLIHNKTLKVGKIHCYNDIQKIAKPLISPSSTSSSSSSSSLLFFSFFFFFFFYIKRPTSKLANALTLVRHKMTYLSPVHDPCPSESS